RRGDAPRHGAGGDPGGRGPGVGAGAGQRGPEHERGVEPGDEGEEPGDDGKRENGIEGGHAPRLEAGAPGGDPVGDEGARAVFVAAWSSLWSRSRPVR